MRILSYNQRETVVPRSEVPVISVEKFEVRQTLDEQGISHSSVVPVNSESILDLPFRSFSMESYIQTGEVTRLKFMAPKQDTSFDAFDRVSGDLDEISAKIDHMTMLSKVVSSDSPDSSNIPDSSNS